MPPGVSQVRPRMMESPESRPDLTVILDSSGTPGSRLPARFLGHSGEVMKIQLQTALGQNLLVSIVGEVDTGTGLAPLLGQYRVRSSRIAGIGKYWAELVQEAPAPKSPPERESAQEPRREPEEHDYYEILQVSRRADTDAIHRIFHVLAQRYHPDNRDTGNDRLFRQVVEAHAVLSHPERRAAYDVRLATDDRIRYKLFDSLQSTQGVQAEMLKRKAILRILYTRRLTDTHQPTMRVRDFTEILGCPIEHLEFSLWFLKECKLILRSDNNQFEITCRGVEAFEAEESNYSRKSHLALRGASEAIA